MRETLIFSATACQNFNGGYVCQCEDGYQGGIEGFEGQMFGDGCFDIDECAIQNADACRVTQGTWITGPSVRLKYDILDQSKF